MKKICDGIKIGLLLLSGLLTLSASCKKDFKIEEQNIDIYNLDNAITFKKDAPIKPNSASASENQSEVDKQKAPDSNYSALYQSLWDQF